MQGLEEAGVVGDPVEDGCGEDHVHLVWHVRVHIQEVHLEEGDLVGKGAECAAGRVEHGWRVVGGDDVAAWQPLQQLGSHPPRATPSIEDHLIARELQPLQHRRPPGGMRLRHAVVATGVPVRTSRRHRCTPLDSVAWFHGEQ